MIVTVRLNLGSQVRCSDAVFGEVADVVVDPTTGRVTHLVVCRRHDPEERRLVPIARASPGAEATEVLLDGTVAEISQLECPRESAFLRVGESLPRDPNWELGIADVYGMPYLMPGDEFGGMPEDPDPHTVVGYDRIPKGEVEIRRASRVTSADGHTVGHVDGLMVADDQHISHVVLEHGHLWGRREVGIPIAEVDHVENDEVVLRLTRDEVGALPAVRVRRGRR
jgi:sporulation protein YlmC with PRC-barrel domain